MGGILAGVIDIRPMRLPDLPGVHRLECSTFPQPWSEALFREELEQNGRHYVVAVDESGELVGYAGLLHVADEAHVTQARYAADAQSHRCRA